MRKLLLLILLLCALAASAHAETRSYTYGGSGHDILYDAAVSADGRIVLTGTTDSSDGTRITILNDDDLPLDVTVIFESAAP